MNTVQLNQSYRQVSPQAIEALKSLEQLYKISNAKIVKRINTISPIKLFQNDRQLTVFDNNPKTRLPKQQFNQTLNQTDRVQPQHNRNISSEIQNFRQQIQDNILLQTVISKYESSPKMNTPVKTSGTQTPTMFIRNSCDNIKSPNQQDSRENKSSQLNLIQKKKLILNQILQLDNEIKLMQDEEVKRQLDPLQEKRLNQKSITPISIKESLEKHVSNSTFMQKLNEWMKKKRTTHIDENQQQEQTSFTQNSVLRDCTFNGNLTFKESNYESFYDRNQKCKKKMNINKQKIKNQKSMIQLKKESKSPNQKVPRPNSSELKCWIRGKELKKSQSPTYNRIQQQLSKKLRF
ncbi:unnamed protein product [Paramecium pentaurelia]|uniref:Uncharacterized protein n=1 Tax=Paramecium pentaurelia TaxID=43138 RepID=A0A8S1WWM5_9CILI|nr:unnamed protein product [Paramecium pentaurelia]